ncbi:MAG: glycosyltransferase [candidate division Zixibacteria bacterium]|nr:glycosyltransferase [candidate division Zixibacteria bacterium]
MQYNEFEISVIIPTYNRGGVLNKCLEALSVQTVPSDSFEIIVSDDGSEDNTRTVTESFARKELTRVRYLWQPNRGASAARNQAILASKGRILLIINDDTIATRTMLEEHLRIHKFHPEENFAVLGRMTISKDIPPSMFAKVHLDASFNLLGEKTDLDWRTFYTCNVSVKKTFLLKYGLFEEKIHLLHEDLELAERLSHNGLKIIYNPRALGYHRHYLEEKDYLSSAKREGKSLVIWYQKAPHLKKELASIGFYLTAPLFRRFRYIVGDVLINRLTIPFLLILARFLSDTREPLALRLYIKIYQSLKRESIRNELFKKHWICF